MSKAASSTLPSRRPEALAGAADVPVGQHVEERPRRVARVGDLVVVELTRHVGDVLVGLGQQVAVQRVGRVGPALRGVAGGVRVEREEVPAVPQRDQHLADALADVALGDDQVAAAQDRAGHQEPAHRVGAVAVEDLAHVGVVAQRLAHLLAVGAEHDAVAQAGLERRPLEDRAREHVHRVEPAARLADVLDDEVAREVVLEPVGVLERVVHLGEAHRPGLEPAVHDVGDPAHRGLRPVGSSGLGRVSWSMNGRCRSSGRTPKSRSSSSSEP